MSEPTTPQDDAPSSAAGGTTTGAFDRTISPISERFGPGLAGRAVTLAALVAGCGLFVAATWNGHKVAAERRPMEAARQVVAFEPMKPAAAPTLAAPGPNAPTLGGGGDQVPALEPSAAPPDPVAARRVELSAVRSAPLIAFSRSGGAPPPSGAEAPAVAPPEADSAEDQTSELDRLRRGTTIGRTRATRIGDRNFLILAGATLPCLLQTAMDTATPGFVSGVLPQDVMSDNGAVVLMAKGTKVLGEYRSSLRQGQARLFVLWTRAVTPDGVAITLASPAADALGRAGFDGDIDTHFWDRFGGALLLSVIDDGTYAAAGRDSGSSTQRLPSDAAATALQNSVNIPPSLRKPQGSEVSIFVAQDLDFSGVYALKAR